MKTKVLIQKAQTNLILKISLILIKVGWGVRNHTFDIKSYNSPIFKRIQPHKQNLYILQKKEIKVKGGPAKTSLAQNNAIF